MAQQLHVQSSTVSESYNTGSSDGETSRGPLRGRSSTRGDPRRHTIVGNQLLLYPQHNSDDVIIEPPIARYGPLSKTMLFDEDREIMSELENASTGFRRGGKQRSSLPVVHTPSKSLKRPLDAKNCDAATQTSITVTPTITFVDIFSSENSENSSITFDSHPDRFK